MIQSLKLLRLPLVGRMGRKALHRTSSTISQNDAVLFDINLTFIVTTSRGLMGLENGPGFRQNHLDLIADQAVLSVEHRLKLRSLMVKEDVT